MDVRVDKQMQERSELVVALFRTAFLVSLLFARAITPRVHGGAEFATDAIVALACFYNLGILISYWRELHFRRERELTVAIDLFLVTVCVWGTGGIESYLFPLYYMVVIVGSYWFDVFGGLLAAGAASVLYLTVVSLGGTPEGYDIQPVVIALVGHVPFLLLIALIVGYMSQAIRAEQELTARHEQEMLMARRIQQELLATHFPPTPGYDIAYRIEPADEIGGDYFDVISLGADRVGICIADVAGRSISAAQHLSLFKFVIHVTAPNWESPRDVAERVNALLLPHLQEDMFIAMFYGVLHISSGRFEYVNAGHTPPLLYGGDGDVFEEMTTGGIVLGALDEPHYRLGVRMLRSGQTLVLCTDGVETARSETGELFGTWRVREAVVQSGKGTASAIADAIVESVQQFRRSNGEDDVTVAVVKILPQDSSGGNKES